MQNNKPSTGNAERIIIHYLALAMILSTVAHIIHV